MENKNEKLMGNFIETLKNSTLPTNAVFNEVQYPTIRTTVNTAQTLILSNSQSFLSFLFKYIFTPISHHELKFLYI